MKRRVEEGERARAHRDRNRHSQTGDERQARILDQHPRAELEVEPPVVERSERARVALTLLRLFHSSERPPRRITRVVGAHALRDVSVLEQLEMRRDLAREVGFRTAGAEEGEQTKKKPSHDVSSYSDLSASVGSIRSARLVGTMHASMHTPIMSAAYAAISATCVADSAPS